MHIVYLREDKILILLASLGVDEFIRSAKNFEVPEEGEHFSKQREAHMPRRELGSGSQAPRFERSNIQKLIPPPK